MGPPSLTIDRLDEKEELILAQSTSQCCRFCCCQPSINWVLSEKDNFQSGQNPFEANPSGWIHEESSFCGRSFAWLNIGCRAQKYVQHAGPPPASMQSENGNCGCQCEPTPSYLSEIERNSNLVATHEKNSTCGMCWTYPLPFPICNCCPLPYLETKKSDGTVIGKTSYICDQFCCVPKYDVTNAQGEKIFHIRPDTCVMGCCVQCRCGGDGGKCCRVPFVIRDPNNLSPVMTDGNESSAQIDSLWSGWANECCRNRNAYHLAFPSGTTAEEKLILTGSGILIDVTVFEQNDDS